MVQRSGARSPRRAQRSIPLRRGSAELGIDRRRQVADAAVWPDGVVVVPPGRQDRPGLGQRGEQGLVEQLVPQPAVEALNEGVLLGFGRGGSGQERLAARHLPALNIKLGAVGVEYSAPGIRVIQIGLTLKERFI